MASVEMSRITNTETAQTNTWESMSTGSLNAGVTDLQEGKNEFLFIIHPANTTVYGAYYLNIYYTKVDLSLDRLEVRPGNKDIYENKIPFKGKDFTSNVFDYEISIDSAHDTYTIYADAQEALASIKAHEGITDKLLIYIGDEYDDYTKSELRNAATEVVEGGNNPVTRVYTLNAEADDIDGTPD
jgi:hypothetical protein